MDTDQQLYDAVNANKMKLVQKLLLHTPRLVNVNAKIGGHHEGPLHRAVLKNNLKIVSMLLVAGAQVGLKDKDGLTPIHWVGLFNTSQKIIKQLVMAR